jgi:hypothetical protein
MEATFGYLRTYAALLGSRILETYPPSRVRKTPLFRGLHRFCERRLFVFEQPMMRPMGSLLGSTGP